MGSMKCIIPGIHVKVFGRAIQSLSKIGDELYFKPMDEGLSLRTVNSSRSAYACFQFAPSFFTTYITGSGKDRDQTTDEDGLQCKMTMKSVMNVFRSLTSIDKTVEKCKIHLDMKEDKLVFEMCCRHGIVKTHNLSFMDCETLQAIFSRDLCPNKLTAGPKLLCDAVLNFQPYQEEITLILRPDFVALKNYIEDEPNPSRVIHTELTLSPDEFDYFQVGVDVDVTFCLKELRAVLSFADLTSLPMNVHIESPGRPVTFAITSDLTFEANFVLATLAPSDDGPCRSQGNVSKTKTRTPSSKSHHDSSKRPQISRQNSSSSEHRERKRKAASAPQSDDDEEMASIVINDITITEPNLNRVQPLPGKPDSGSLSLPRDRPFDSADPSGSCDVNRNKNIESSEKTLPSKSNADINHINRPDPLVRTASGSKEERGFYLSASEESVEIARVARSDAEMRVPENGIGLDEANDLSQIIPIHNETLKNTVTTIGSGVFGDDHKKDQEEEDDEPICSTPPSKRFRSLFFNTQSSTQSTIASQRKPAVLCPDSDSDD